MNNAKPTTLFQIYLRLLAEPAWNKMFCWRQVSKDYLLQKKKSKKKRYGQRKEETNWFKKLSLFCCTYHRTQKRRKNEKSVKFKQSYDCGIHLTKTDCVYQSKNLRQTQVYRNFRLLWFKEEKKLMAYINVYNYNTDPKKNCITISDFNYT